MDKYRCTVCGYIYDPELGDDDSGIAAGTAFERVGAGGWDAPRVDVQRLMAEDAEDRWRSEAVPRIAAKLPAISAPALNRRVPLWTKPA